jgi:hypothetical protein
MQNQESKTKADDQLRAFLQQELPPSKSISNNQQVSGSGRSQQPSHNCVYNLSCTAGGLDPVTALSDLWAHAHIAPALRDAALNLSGSDVYRKVKPPGDTRLYRYCTYLRSPTACTCDVMLDLR